MWEQQFQKLLEVAIQSNLPRAVVIGGTIRIGMGHGASCCAGHSIAVCLGLLSRKLKLQGKGRGLELLPLFPFIHCPA
jgi:hypothetical protein